MNLLNKHLDLPLDDRLQLQYSDTRKKSVDHSTVFFVQHWVNFRKYGVWSVEPVVEWRIFGKGFGLAVDNFVQVGITNIQLIGSNAKGLRI